MNAIGWGFILTALLLIAATLRGQVVDSSGKFILWDNARTFLQAIITGDTKTIDRLSNAEGGGYESPPVAPTEATPSAGPTPTGNYKLGNVKPHVQRAADTIGPMFGIKTIGGYRSVGSVPGSLHPRGLALDFMCNRDQGDRLAAYLRANHAQYGVTQVIWNRRIWTVERGSEGWRAYVGPSAHTDHVHASFAESV